MERLPIRYSTIQLLILSRPPSTTLWQLLSLYALLIPHSAASRTAGLPASSFASSVSTLRLLNDLMLRRIDPALPASLQLLPRIPSGHQRHLPAIEARLKQAVRADGEWTVSEHKVEAEMDDVRVELSVALLLQDVWLPSAENGEAVDSVSVHFLSLLDERKESGLQEEKPLPSQSGPKAKRVKQRA